MDDFEKAGLNLTDSQKAKFREIATAAYIASAGRYGLLELIDGLTRLQHKQIQALTLKRGNGPGQGGIDG